MSRADVAPPARIAAAQSGDLEDLATLAKAALGGRFSAASLARDVTGECGRVLAAHGPSGPVGLLVARRAADVLEVHHLAVDPDWRRRGVGRALLAAALEPDLSVVQLELRADNDDALRFYAALGFVAVGRRPRYYRDGGDAVLMTRELRARGETS